MKPYFKVQVLQIIFNPIYFQFKKEKKINFPHNFQQKQKKKCILQCQLKQMFILILSSV